MPKVFVDTDVAMDLLTGRTPHYSSAALIFSLADEKKISAYISSLSISNLNYILRSGGHNSSSAKRILKDFKALVQILSVDDHIIQQALDSEFTDLEDAIQHFTALNNAIPIIITRNLKDYKKSVVLVSSPEQYLKTM